MADQSAAVDLIPPNPNPTDFDALAIPPLDSAFLSDSFFSDLALPFDADFDDLDFTFDDLYLPSDSEDFLNSFPSQFSSDPSPDASTILNSADQTSSQFSGDPEISEESGIKGSDVGSRVLNYSSPESETRNSGSAESGNFAIVDQKIEFEGEGKNFLSLKRKKGSEDVNFESRRIGKYRRSSSGGNANSPCGLNGNNEEDEKKKARLIRNRESAQLSRQRRKHYVGELEDKVRLMHSTIQDLNTRISYVIAENASLRQQLGGAMCPPPPGMYPHPPLAPLGYPWMPCPPYFVKPQGSQAPLVPIPKLKPQQSAPAPKAKKVESKKSESKTKKVASVSFLGLLLFILLFGGLVPMINVKFGGMQDRVPGGSDYLGNRFYDHHSGRVLPVDGNLNNSDQTIGTGLCSGRLGIGNNFTNTLHCGRGDVGRVDSNVECGGGLDEFVRPGNSSVPLVASLYVPRNDKLVRIDGNLIIHSILASEKAMASRQDREMVSSKETGLAVAGNMPPAIPLIGTNNGRHPNLYKSPSEQQRALGRGSVDKSNLKSTALDGKVQQWFQEGLAGSMLNSGMCTEVFRFDVSPAPGAIVPATSVMNVSTEHCQNATHLFKGRNRRILHGAPIPLPSGQNNISKDNVGKNPQKDNFRGNNSRSSVVVSVLVDPREAGDGDGDGVMGPKSLSRIFVVVLMDSVKYVTYSCMLPLKGSGTYLMTT
ncbi:unnamed protein product [Camellia sinensis]